MLHKNIKALRNKGGFSQRYVAENIGCHRNSLSAWEAGSRKPSSAHVKKLADFFGVGLGDLLGKEIKIEF